MMQNNKNSNSQKIRYDLQVVADIISPNSKVLDIGCGDGELLNFLKNTKNIDARGLEISHTQVSKAIIRGLSVIHGNAENDLSIYPDKSFDYAVLSQTIQATQNPPKILLEMLRIANYAVVSLPNFAHIRNRFDLMFKGQMPVNKTIPYQWYETPNIHFCSILDFEKLCNDLDFNIKKKFFLTSNHCLSGFFGNEFFSNLFAKYGIFLITKNEFKPSNQEEFAFKTLVNLGYKTAISNYDYKKIKIND
jgi:methionine biosynthesis protein MetW